MDELWSGSYEEEHVQIRQIGLGLEPFPHPIDLFERCVIREEEIGGHLAFLYERLQVPQQVCLKEFDRMSAHGAQRCSQCTTDWHGSEKYGAGELVVLEETLNDQSSHRVGDDDRWLVERVDHFGDVFHVMLDSRESKRAVVRAGAVTSQVEGMRHPAALSKPALEVVPTPGSVPGTVDEQERMAPGFRLRLH